MLLDRDCLALLRVNLKVSSLALFYSSFLILCAPLNRRGSRVWYVLYSAANGRGHVFHELMNGRG